ncbi:hypothetical protein XELAEV_18031074mg [Xenopus laevis]|uniref:Uncharacterized protein n=1 Tax=Xenopus laevis TaxID=8355 RepID=A0A974HFE6_XENLA|nr:hypothetical protein XELAEV_18031074mg [Xenopus laevis]
MINKDLCDHHTFPEEAVKGDCETRWILEQFDLFIDHRLNRRNFPGPRELRTFILLWVNMLSVSASHGAWQSILQPISSEYNSQMKPKRELLCFRGNTLNI